MKDRSVLRLQKDYHGKYQDFINWPLTRHIELGDIGLWSSGKTFTHEENISNYDIVISTRSGGSVGSRGYTSAGGVEVSFKPVGDIPLPSTSLITAKAGVSLFLNTNHACVLQARDLQEEVVTNRPELEAALLGLRKDPEWWKHRVVVTSVVRADLVTVALARARKQRVDISAGVKTGVPFAIVDASLDLQIGYQGADTIVELLAKDVVLAFQHSSLRKGRWRHTWARSSGGYLKD